MTGYVSLNRINDVYSDAAFALNGFAAVAELSKALLQREKINPNQKTTGSPAVWQSWQLNMRSNDLEKAL